MGRSAALDRTGSLNLERRSLLPSGAPNGGAGENWINFTAGLRRAGGSNSTVVSAGHPGNAGRQATEARTFIGWPGIPTPRQPFSNSKPFSGRCRVPPLPAGPAGSARPMSSRSGPPLSVQAPPAAQAGAGGESDATGALITSRWSHTWSRPAVGPHGGPGVPSGPRPALR